MPKRTPRTVTETHASCNLCRQMVELENFGPRRSTCNPCRSEQTRLLKYRAGKTCVDCGAKITNVSIRCQPCHYANLRAQRRGRTYRRYVLKAGYASLSAHFDHPNANARGFILEHVKVMSEMIGRPLEKGENVHHINGVKDDNRPENLELWVKSQPAGQRAADLVAWAKEILARYGDVPSDRV